MLSTMLAERVSQLILHYLWEGLNIIIVINVFMHFPLNISCNFIQKIKDETAQRCCNMSYSIVCDSEL